MAWTKLDGKPSVTPQVFIFLSTTSTDLSTQYQWIKWIVSSKIFKTDKFIRVWIADKFMSGVKFIKRRL
jgi:hypothetical protein